MYVVWMWGGKETKKVSKGRKKIKIKKLFDLYGYI